MKNESGDPSAPVTIWLKTWGLMILGAAMTVYAVVGHMSGSIEAATRTGSVILTNVDASVYALFIGTVGIVLYVIGLAERIEWRK